MVLDYVPSIINSIRYIERSRKSRICSKCGREIPKGDPYLQWKPLPTSTHWYTWVDLCIECKPRHYNEHLHYQDQDQIKKHKIIGGTNHGRSKNSSNN